MTLVSSGVSRKPVDKHARPCSPHSWWTPRWLRRWREADELGRWASELLWQWSHTMDGAHLSQPSWNAGGTNHTVAPQVHSVEPGPPVTLLVRMLPGQVVDDFQAEAHRIAAGMEVPMVRIVPFDTGWIKVVFADQ